MKPIVVVKAHSSEIFTERCSQYLAEGYKISSTSCDATEIFPAPVTFYQAVMVLKDTPKQKETSHLIPYFEPIQPVTFMAAKIELFDIILNTVNLCPTRKMRDRAIANLSRYDYRSIELSGEAFAKAVYKDNGKNTLRYFFGVLSNIHRKRIYNRRK